MFAQTFGDVAALGECRLIESFAFSVENKSFAELLDSTRPGNWFSGPFPMGHDGRQKLKVADMRPQISKPAFIVIVKAQSVSR